MDPRLFVFAIAGSSLACTLKSSDLNLTDNAGTIRSPQFVNHFYPNDQRCSWTISANRQKAVILSMKSLSTGPSDGTCNADYVVLPHGQRLCGRRATPTCFAYVSGNNTNCLARLNQCRRKISIYAMAQWPPVVKFVTNGRGQFGGFVMSYSLRDCPTGPLVATPPINSNRTGPPQTAATAQIPTTAASGSKTEKLMLTQLYFEWFTATAITCGVMLVVIVFLAILFFQTRKSNKRLEKLFWSKNCQEKTSVNNYQGQAEEGYVDAHAAEVSSVTYEYIQPAVLPQQQNNLDGTNYELPIPTKRLAYVNLHT